MTVDYIQHRLVTAFHFVGAVVGAETHRSPDAAVQSRNVSGRQSYGHPSIDDGLQVIPHRFQGGVPLPDVLQELEGG